MKYLSLGNVTFGISNLRLGEVSYEIVELGKVSFGTSNLRLGEVSYEIVELADILFCCKIRHFKCFSYTVVRYS